MAGTTEALLSTSITEGHHYGGQYGGSLKTKIWSSNPTPGHITRHEKNSNLKRYMHPMFPAALFPIANIWKQPKCPSTDDWIKKMWYIYTMDYYSAIKENKIIPWAATWVDLETLILSELSQKEKDKYHMVSLICGIFKNDTNECISKTEIDSQVQITNCGYQKWRGVYK